MNHDVGKKVEFMHIEVFNIRLPIYMCMYPNSNKIWGNAVVLCSCPSQLYNAIKHNSLILKFNTQARTVFYLL